MINTCFVIGVNYTTATIAVRSNYSISTENQEALLKLAMNKNVASLLILNTCNRTEIAGMGNVEEVIEMYFAVNGLDPQHRDHLFVKTGQDAIEHLFRVSSGLDSQIIGDLDILGQFKNAFQFAKQHNSLNGYYERLGNFCVQNAKEIRHNTNLSNGTTSHAYAVVKFLKDKQISRNDRVLVIGVGEFGTGVAKNIQDYLPESELVLTNRTFEKAEKLASQLGCTAIPFDKWKEQLPEFRVVIAAVSNVNGHLITSRDLQDHNPKILIDTSVPSAIETGESEHALITVDDLSAYINHTLEKRISDLPLAQSILDKNLAAFLEWNLFQEKSVSIKSWRSQLEVKARSCPYLQQLPREIIEHYVNKSVGQFAEYIRTHNQVPVDNKEQEILNTFLKVYHASHVPKNASSLNS